MPKNENVFWSLQTLLNDFYQTIVHLNTLTHPLIKLLQKEIDFYLIETCNEAFGKLKLFGE